MDSTLRWTSPVFTGGKVDSSPGLGLLAGEEAGTLVGLGLVERTPLELCTRWPLMVFDDSGKYFAALEYLRLDQVAKLPALMALSHVSLTGKSAATCRYPDFKIS